MSSLPSHFHENIMVCKTRLLYREFPFEWFLPAWWYDFVDRITKIHERQERDLVEDDANYQQIIPYIICYKPDLQSFLVYKRPENHCGHTMIESERFANTRSLGIWGHISEKLDHDIAPDEFLLELSKEILEEEIGNIGLLWTSVIWFINDNSHAVERVHFAVVIWAIFSKKNISWNKEKIQELKLMKKDEMLIFFAEQGDNVETWTKILETIIEHGEIF